MQRMVVKIGMCSLLLGCRAETQAIGDTGIDTSRGELVIGVSWVPQGGVELALAGGHPDGYWFGMAQTGATDGWFGEDCMLGQDGYTICHPATSEGVSLHSVHPDLGGGGRIAVVDGESTYLYEGISDTVTYFLMEISTDECWSWGHDPSYYASGGCESAQ